MGLKEKAIYLIIYMLVVHFGYSKIHSCYIIIESLIEQFREEALMKDLEKEVSLDERDAVAGGVPDVEDMEDTTSDFESSGIDAIPKVPRKRKLPEPETKRRRTR